jgi:hypothetical protein
MLHVCGFSQVHLDFDFFRNPALKKLMGSGKLVYDEHFRVAVYFGKAPGFPEFGANGGALETCKTGVINTAETHGNSGLRVEMAYAEEDINSQWSATRSSSDPKVVESVLRPVYIDWEDWTSCEWCLYGDAMPSKCVRRIDPFASPAQYSYITYFGAYNDKMFDECESPRVHEDACKEICQNKLKCVAADDIPLANKEVLEMYKLYQTDPTNEKIAASIKIVAGSTQYQTWLKFFQSKTAPGNVAWDSAIHSSGIGNECCQSVDPAGSSDQIQTCARYKPPLFTSAPRQRRLDADLSSNLRDERSVCLSFCSAVRTGASPKNPDWETEGIGYGKNPGPGGTLSQGGSVYRRQALPKSFRRASVESTIAVRATQDAKER